MKINKLPNDIEAYIKENIKALPNLEYMNKYFYFIDIITNNDIYSLKDQCSYYYGTYDNDETLSIGCENINYSLIYDMAFDETIIFENKNKNATNKEKYMHFIDFFKKQIKKVRNNPNYYTNIYINRKCSYYTPSGSSTPSFYIYERKGKEPLKDFFNALTGGLINKLDEKEFIYRQNYINELLNSKSDKIYNLNYSYTIEDLIYHSDLKQMVFQLERRVEEICENINDKDRTPFLQQCYEIIRLIYPNKGANEILNNTQIGAYIRNTEDKNNIKADIFFKTVFLGLIYNESMDATFNHFKGNIDADIKERYEYFARDIKNRALYYKRIAEPKYVIYSNTSITAKEFEVTYKLYKYTIKQNEYYKCNEGIYNCLTGGLFEILNKRPCTYLIGYKKSLLKKQNNITSNDLILDEDKGSLFFTRR